MFSDIRLPYTCSTRAKTSTSPEITWDTVDGGAHRDDHPGRPGEGSTFTVLLPVDRARFERAGRDPSARGRGTP
jgi:hypothetical protein